MLRMRNLFIWIGSFLVLAAAALGTTVYVTSGDPKATQPVSFTGSWTAQQNSTTFVATITDDGIEIQWNNGIDTSALYWKGTFPMPLNAHQGDMFEVISVGDTEAMSNSIMGSQDASKVFTYDNGRLNFKMTIIGIQTIIHLEKNGSPNGV